jgi:hypothetical protein
MRAFATRRSFLREFAFSVAFLFARPLHVVLREHTSSAHDKLVLRLAGVLEHRESAAIIGGEYLRCVPEENNIDVLVDLMCSPGRGEQGELMYSGDAKALRAILSSRQRDDFAHDRTIKVQGWILSATEVRLCALAALTADSSCSG